MLKLRPSSFSSFWWKLEKLVRGREQNLDFVEIPREGPNGNAYEENGKGEEKNLGELENKTTNIEFEKPPC